MQALIKDHTGQILCVTFIHVRKAFDRVSCDSLLLAAKRFGVPDHLLTYLRTFYTDATTVLRVGGRDSGPIVLGKGVFQGDPLSPILFSCVIDWVLADLHPSLGVTMGKERLTHVAFADNLGLVISSDVGMRKQLDTLVREGWPCRKLEKIGVLEDTVGWEKKKLGFQSDFLSYNWVSAYTGYDGFVQVQVYGGYHHGYRYQNLTLARSSLRGSPISFGNH